MLIERYSTQRDILLFLDDIPSYSKFPNVILETIVENIKNIPIRYCEMFYIFHDILLEYI